MSRFSTGVALVALTPVVVSTALATTLVHQGLDASSQRTSAPTRHARLLPTQVNPLRVKGTGFFSRERVRLKVIASSSMRSRSVTASFSGFFVVTFPGVSACDGTTVTARGSRGSRASFTFSQIVCLEP